MKKSTLLLALAAVSLTAQAQQWHEGDIQWIQSSKFADNIATWTANHKLTDDDNFFISRVRPKMRFQNTATQVREDLKWGENDRRLVAWMPVNTHQGDVDTRDALPTGTFDQEVFTMWSYVDHWGDWTAPLGMVPAGLADVAHKNGVAVSGVASIAFGTISDEWSAALRKITSQCSNADAANAYAAKAAKMLAYYGCDGIGYNSEFSGFGATQLSYLRNFHQYLLTNLKAEYQKTVPGYDMQENIWYDGTNDNGGIQFDGGLGLHNYQTWGPKGEERTSLFFNYNWPGRGLLQGSVNNANHDTYGKGRTTLDLYCGLNMQGGEPRANTDPWNIFKNFNFSIGLWGQHKVNMFFEGRGSRGTSPENQQSTYQHRIENWFTGGTHNPVNVPTELSKVVTCATEDTGFHGMSTFMTGRSTLSWDLTNEAFVTYFSTGNGKFFNWKGERQNNNEWYNLGAQDFMPTWRWWWTSKFLGKTAADVPAEGLTAALSWNDAYIGGSALRVTGSTTPAEYLHLFKTAYELKAGDVITFVYKLANGTTEASLVLSVNGAESTVAKEIALCDASVLSDDSEWHTVKYTVANNDGLAGKTLAMIAMKFANAVNADMYLGEISIKRGTLATPAKPVIERAQVLRSHYAGVDAKVIFKMDNNKPAGEVCYNDDVKTSFFKIYSREEGQEPVLLGITPSWAAMCYSAPFSGDENGNGKIAFGVQAVSMDHNSESEIAWSDNIASGARTYSDQIVVDKTTITPGESFTLSAVDGKRAFAWEIWTAGDNSKKVAESGETSNAWTCEGIDAVGTYDVKCIGENNTDAGFVLVKNFLVVTDASKGRIPEILTLTANESEVEISVKPGEEVTLEYTGREANGSASRGIMLQEKFFGVEANELMTTKYDSFSIAGWLKITELPGDCVWIDVRGYDGNIWPRNNWGWLWTNIKQDGTLMDFHHDLTDTDGGGAISSVLVYDFENGKKTFFNPGQWTHFAFTFDRDENKCRSIIYINGERIESKWFYYTGTGDDHIADPYTTSRTPAQQGTTEDYVNASKSLPINSTQVSPYISIGGTRHTGRGGGLGFTGVLDDFQVWDHAMTQDEVNASMAGLDGNNLPAGVLAYWDFEEAPNGDNMFAAKGSKAGAMGGYYKLAQGVAEGEGLPAYEIPLFTSGCPFIPGHDYKIETAPEWSIRKTMVTPVEGNDQAGKAIAKMALEGEYTAILTLKNDLGADKKEFRFIKVSDPNSIESVGADNDMRTYTVDDVLFLEVTEDGNYDVTVYNTAGMQVAAKSQFVSGGSYMRLNFGNASGVYVVKVLANGNAAKSFKVIKK